MQCARCISGVIHPLFSSGFDYFFLFVYPFACDALPDYIICRVVVVVFAKFKAYISYFFPAVPLTHFRMHYHDLTVSENEQKYNFHLKNIGYQFSRQNGQNASADSKPIFGMNIQMA